MTILRSYEHRIKLDFLLGTSTRAATFVRMLYGISDLHLERPTNWKALTELPTYPNDWLVVAGDLAETESRFVEALDLLTDRFAKVLWVPGNHDLWTLPSAEPDPNRSRDERKPAEHLRGVAKYERLVSLCRDRSVVTPEDPFPKWPGNENYLLAPTFTLYDYTFRPEDVAASPTEAIAWARETGISCADERFLHPDPHPSVKAWCMERCLYTEQRLAEASSRGELIIINHYPLRNEHAVLPLIPRFKVWCGTRRTQNWHTRYQARMVIHGHLHIRRQRQTDGVRFQEVSLGYPKQWHQPKGISSYLYQILPG